MPNAPAFRHACITLLLSNAAVLYGGLSLVPTITHYEIREPNGLLGQYRVLLAFPKNLDNAEEIVTQFMEMTGVRL